MQGSTFQLFRDRFRCAFRKIKHLSRKFHLTKKSTTPSTGYQDNSEIRKPLTTDNLRHMEMLSGFELVFGTTNLSQIVTASFCGVSPLCTRPASVELEMGELGPIE